MKTDKLSSGIENLCKVALLAEKEESHKGIWFCNRWKNNYYSADGTGKCPYCEAERKRRVQGNLPSRGNSNKGIKQALITAPKVIAMYSIKQLKEIAIQSKEAHTESSNRAFYDGMVFAFELIERGMLKGNQEIGIKNNLVK